ncbi:hypothetical protein DF152_17325 [Burkholderia cenocepacia]|nr:hypothetical protein DF152_17325 [Burkholderia cenocepacia]
MTEFDAQVIKLRILEASIEVDEMHNDARSQYAKARLRKVRDTLDDALRVVRKYAPDTRVTS